MRRSVILTRSIGLLLGLSACTPSVQQPKGRNPAPEQKPESTGSRSLPSPEAPGALPQREACMDPVSATRSLVSGGSSERELWACYENSAEDSASCAFWSTDGRLLRIENNQQLSGVLSKLRPAHVEADPKLNVQPKDGRLQLCTNGPDDCRALPRSIKPDAGVTPVVALSSDRRRALLLDPRYTDTDVRLHTTVLDYSTLKPVAAHVSERAFEGYEDWYAIWPGRLAILSAMRCCGPDGHTLLVDPETGEWERLHGYRGSVAAIGGSTYLVLDEKRVRFLDVDKGATTAGPRLSGAVPDDVTSVLGSVISAARVPPHTEARTVLIATAFPPTLVRLEDRKVAAEYAVPLCNSSAAPREN